MASRNMEDLAEVFRTLRFKKKLFGGVDEMDVWKKLDKLQKEYRSVYELQEEVFKVRLQERDEEIAALKERISQESAYE